MAAMNETLESPASRVGVTLPRFNPDVVELNARSWCAAAEPCAVRRAEQPLQGLRGGELVLALS
ncbi:hypothetical protein JYU34_015880 [Plutella xylostella]|uniref:Uncharacterized protein n=1 Tax=Plutella xylostella TaxID=51655 RepID=A0ABQ7Q4X6_PLUXY|nr:hypothetical protein JYU34_015880 [Plutella xylostella]